MFGGALALMTRSLRVDDRLLRTHLFRIAFLGLIYFCLIVVQSTGSAFGAPGLYFFRAICYMNFFFITVAAVSFFATSITEEKEEMTLGLLRMAGISPVSMLLGKSTPRLITAALLLSAQFPFTLLAITMGGVSLHQVLAAYCTLLAYLVFVGNLALFFSVVSQRSNGAGWRTGIVLGCILLGPPIVGAAKPAFILQGWIGAGGWLDTSLQATIDWMNSVSAYRRINMIMSTGFAQSAINQQVIVNLTAGVVSFVLAWAVFNRCTRDEKPAAPARGLLTKRLTGLGCLGPRRAWSLAHVWKEFHFVTGGKVMILAKFVLYGILLGLIAYVATSTNRGVLGPRDFGNIIMSSMLAAMMIETALYASRIFHAELKWRTLPTILILPTSVAQIAYSKVVGCAIALLPAASYFIMGAYFNPQDLAYVVGDLWEEPQAWYAIAMYIVFVHLVAFLSLYIKWGALPLAFALTYILGVMFVPLVWTIRADFGIALMASMLFLVALGLHIGIGKRLRLLAAK